MANILTPSEVRAIVTPNVRFDVGYYEKNIEEAQRKYLKEIMTTGFYNDFIANLGALPVLYQLLNDSYIKYIVAYGTAIISYKKDLTPQTDNQGIMTNSPQYSNQDSKEGVKGMLMQLDNILWDYREGLAEYLIDNAVDFPLWDTDTACLTLNLRDYIKY